MSSYFVKGTSVYLSHDAKKFGIVQVALKYDLSRNEDEPRRPEFEDASGTSENIIRGQFEINAPFLN